MIDYLLSTDAPLLRTRGFKAGWSGESWHGKDKTGEEWQAYVVGTDTKMTFVPATTRESQFMQRDVFEELFP